MAMNTRTTKVKAKSQYRSMEGERAAETLLPSKINSPRGSGNKNKKMQVE